MSENIDEQSDSSLNYFAAPRIFQGKELAGFSMGNRELVGMIGLPGDNDSFWLECVIYVLSHPRLEVQKLARNRDEARCAVLDWLDGLKLTPDELNKLIQLGTEIVTEAKKDKVDPIATAAGGNAPAPAT